MRITETQVIKISIDVDGQLEDAAYLEVYEQLLLDYDIGQLEYIDMTTDGLTYTYTWEVTL